MPLYWRTASQLRARRRRGCGRTCAWRAVAGQSNAPVRLRRLRSTPCCRSASTRSGAMPSSPSTSALHSPWKYGTPGAGSVGAAEAPRRAGHAHRAALAIVDVHDGAPVLRPFRLGQILRAAHDADGQAGLADLRLQLVEVGEGHAPRRGPRPSARRGWPCAAWPSRSAGPSAGRCAASSSSSARTSARTPGWRRS